MTDPATNGGEAPGKRPPTPAPLVLSCVAGALGLALLIAGAVSGTAGLSVAGFVAGSASLGAALYWRSLLISSWADQKRRRPPR
ncbi:MAG: hypothetical protein ACR2MO_04950 [Acidimicrobiales bacterium]